MTTSIDNFHELTKKAQVEVLKSRIEKLEIEGHLEDIRRELAEMFGLEYDEETGEVVLPDGRKFDIIWSVSITPAPRPQRITGKRGGRLR